MKRSVLVSLFILIIIFLFSTCGNLNKGYSDPSVEKMMVKLEKKGKPEADILSYTVFQIYEKALKNFLELSKGIPTDDKTYQKLKEMQLYYIKKMWQISLHYKKFSEQEQAVFQRHMSIMANTGDYLAYSAEYMERLNAYRGNKRYSEVLNSIFPMYGLFREEYIKERHPQIYAEITK